MKMKMNTFLKLSIAAMAVFSVSACSVFNPNNGKDINENIKTQTINPYAGFEENTATLDGQKAEKLLKEYRTEKAAAPDEKLLKNVGN
jgi:hypothetical protein